MRMPFHLFWANTLKALQPLVSGPEMACIRAIIFHLLTRQQLPIDTQINPSMWCWSVNDNRGIMAEDYLRTWFHRRFPDVDQGKVMELLLDASLYADGLPRLTVLKRGHSYVSQEHGLVHCMPIFGLPQQVYHQLTLELLDEFWAKYAHPSCSLQTGMYGQGQPE